MLERTLHNEGLPPGERFEWWREMIDRSTLPTAITSDFAPNFQAATRQLFLGDTRASVLSYSPMLVRRLPSLIRRSDPEFYQLILVVGGERHMSQNGRDVVVGEGNFLLTDSSHPYTTESFSTVGPVKGIMVDIPRSELSLPRTDTLLATELPGSSGIGYLLSRFLMQIATESASLEHQDATRLEPVAHGLITSLLAHHLDATPHLSAENRQQTLLAAIHVFIDRNLGDPSLSPATIAAAHSISVRYLHRIFQRKGGSVSAWIRSRRLEFCRRDLIEPLLLHKPIHSITARWGFHRAPEFSRAFRAHYGTSPSDYRNHHLPRGSSRADAAGS